MINCVNIEPLRFILERAGSAPLTLSIQWPVAEGTLELISSYKSPIHSLKLGSIYPGTVEINRLLDLNLSLLSELRISGTDNNIINTVLDLVLSWNLNNLSIYLKLRVTDGIHPVFNHKLMHHVVYLDIMFRQ
jgi:hypothetical protein